MKRFLLVLALLAGSAAAGFSVEPAGSQGANSGRTSVYTFFVNVVFEPFRFPLVGLVNIAVGNHGPIQLGLVNMNTGNFAGAQTALVNIAGGNFSGAQVGLTNISAGNTGGAQIGLTNASRGEIAGAQIGLTNVAMRGGQAWQIGLVNVSARALRGTQIGLVNFVDSIEGGIPIGLVSIVRTGGFRAVEYVFTEFHPVGVGLKLGVERFYTTISVAYAPSGDGFRESFAVGFGIGTIIPVGTSFFFNPELTSFAWNFHREGQPRQLLSFVPFAGFNINRHFSVIAGPSVTWSHVNDSGALAEPVFSIWSRDINDRNAIVVGARAGARFRF